MAAGAVWLKSCSFCMCYIDGTRVGLCCAAMDAILLSKAPFPPGMLVRLKGTPDAVKGLWKLNFQNFWLGITLHLYRCTLASVYTYSLFRLALFRTLFKNNQHISWWNYIDLYLWSNRLIKNLRKTVSEWSLNSKVRQGIHAEDNFLDIVQLAYFLLMREYRDRNYIFI